jgi:hypothetical protein
LGQRWCREARVVSHVMEKVKKKIEEQSRVLEPRSCKWNIYAVLP